MCRKNHTRGLSTLCSKIWFLCVIIFHTCSYYWRRWVDNIRMDLQEVGRGYVDWIGLAQDREGWRTLVSAVMNLRVP